MISMASWEIPETSSIGFKFKKQVQESHRTKWAMFQAPTPRIQPWFPVVADQATQMID